MKYLITILISIITLQVWSQANAGPDKVLCNSSTVQIGTTGNGSDCYKWTPEIGLDNPISPTPIASPTTTTTYTLTVVSGDLSSKTTDNVTVTVNIGGVTFIPNYLVPDGQSQTLAIASYIPSGQSLSWSIEGNSLGATVFLPVTGMITAGTQEGTITIRATTQPNGCYTEKDIDINGGVEDVTATDLNPPNGAPRVAHAGETLYLVDDNGAEIKAIPKDATGFPPNYPQWSGFSPLEPNGTVFFSNSSAFDATYTANTKSVTVNRMQKMTVTTDFGFFTPSQISSKLEDKLKFSIGGNEFEVNFSGKISFIEETVEKYANPDYGYKYEGSVGIEGKISGKIVAPPPWSGNYTDPVFGLGAKYELFAEAGLSLKTSGGLVFDPSQPNNHWGETVALNATLGGELKVGLDIMLNAGFLKAGGGFNVSTGLSGTLGLSGCQVKANLSWPGIVGEASFKVYRSDPNNPYFERKWTANFIDGGSTSPLVIWNLCTQ